MTPDASYPWMQSILRSLGMLSVLLLAVGGWMLASARLPATMRVLSAEMAPVALSSSGGLPHWPADQTRWRALDQRELAHRRGPYWLRWRFSAASADYDVVYALKLSLRAASRLYWNGEPLPGNGVVGRTADEERPGLIDIVRVLPVFPLGVEHELLVLASSQHQHVPLYTADAGVVVAPTESIYAQPIHPWLVAAFAAGALAVAFLYFLVAQYGRAHVPGARFLLMLGVVSLLLPGVEALRPLLGYAYPWHGPRLVVLQMLHLAAAFLLPVYLARRFGVALPRIARIAYPLLLALVIVLVPSFDGRSAALLLLSLFVSAAVLLVAHGDVVERWPILILVVAGAAAIPITGAAFLDGPYFILLTTLMCFLLLRHGALLRGIERRNAWLQAEHARLSLQLLQQSMQPHWLMNTLTCLQELIEQAPLRASGLVESLAEQFRHLRDSSTRQQVCLEDELALCRTHLDIVGQALNCVIGLEVEADDTQLQLPPGVLHAQIENALTHAGARACAQRGFHLRVARAGKHWTLELRSACGAVEHPGQGTGTRYIEASLAAHYPAGWQFEQAVNGDDWYSKIELVCGY